MGNEFRTKLGASIIIAVMLLASFSFIGMSVVSEPEIIKEAADGRVTGLKAVEIDPAVKEGLSTDNIPKLSPTSIESPRSLQPSLEPLGLFPPVDTERCVLAEFGSGIDTGSFVPSFSYALDQTMNSYSRSDVAPMMLNTWAEDYFAAPGYTDSEYSPGDYLQAGDCDAALRQFYLPPYGLDTYTAYGDPLTGGATTVNTGIWAVDGMYSTADGSDTFYNDADWTWDGRWDDAGGAGTACVQPAIDTRLLDPSDFTMTLNGTFNDATDWANISLSISAINDMDTYDPEDIYIHFWFVDDYDVVETRNNAYNNDGTAGDGPSDKNIYIRNSMQSWFGTDYNMTGYLDSKGDTITYQDIAFGRVDPRPYPGGASKPWNGPEAGVICSIMTGDGVHHQTVYYQFANTQPDLAIAPTGINAVVYEENETVFGPSVGGEMGPIYLDYGNVFNCTMYISDNGEWDWLEPMSDYFINNATGEIDISPLAPFDPGFTFYAYYNHSAQPIEGDILPIDITIDNAGNGASGANVIVGIYDGDPTQGGALLGTQDAGPMAAESTVNFIYNWDTTGFAGFHSICVIPDHLDNIGESNENNNIAALEVYVAPPDDVGVVSQDSFVDLGTYDWGDHAIDATIGNYGTAAQGPFDVRCIINHVGSSVYLLNDDVESGALPGWTPAGTWAIGSDGHSGAASWEFPPYTDVVSDESLEYGPFDLTGAFTSATWTWWHQYSWEAPNWDGGIVEVSGDGAAWTQVTSANGYDDVIPNTYANPLMDLDAFCGAIGWTEDSVDLTPWLGDPTVWVRYRAGTDNWNGPGQTGWDVDDIRIFKTAAGPGEVYNVVKQTTLNPMNQYDTEPMQWNYNFNDEAEWTVLVRTELAGDVVTTNDEILLTIYTLNMNPPSPVTNLYSEQGGAGGASVYQQTTSDIAVENNGGTIDHTITHMPVDGTSEQIVEAVTPPVPDTWNNYTVASDMPVEGTVANDYTFIDENPPTGDTETIEEVFGPAITNIINGESFESAWPAGWTVGGAWTRSATVTPPYHLTVNAECDPDSGAGDLTSNVMDTSGYDPLQLDFGYIDSGVEPGEGTVWAYTSTAGGTWVEILDVDLAASFTKYSNTWTFGANPEYFWAGFQLEFRQGGAQGNDEWAIDYVWLNGTGAGVPSLEHKWTTDPIPAGYDALNLYVRGLSSDPADDVFSVFWSNDDISYIDTGIDIDQAALTDYAPFAFPLGETGVLYIQVIDDNTGDAALTTCEIDAIRLEWYENTATPASYSLEHQWQFEDVTAADSHNFHAFVGWDGAGAGDDTFAYYGSTTGAFAGEEFLMFTDTTQAIDELTYDLGAGYTGAFYVMVEDTAASDAEDTVYIDCMYVDSATGGLGTVNDVVLRWTLSPDDGAGANDVTGYDVYKADSAAGDYYEGAYVYLGTSPAGQNNFIDTNEWTQAETSWYYVTATDGMYDSLASGIVSDNEIVPVTSNVLADGVSPHSIPIGTPSIVLTADILDNTTNDENVMPFMIGGEWYLDADPGEGAGTPILPVDALWDGPYESISEVIDTSLWGAGTHWLYVRGNSPLGWGVPVGVQIDVTGGSTFLIPVQAGWNFISTPLVPGDTTVPTVFTDTDLDTSWTMLKHYDGADLADHWKSYDSTFPGTHDLNNVDETMGAWIFVTVVGDGFINLGGLDPVATSINLVAGWNMVGFPSIAEGYTAGDLKTDSGGLVTSIERYNDAVAYDIEVMPDGDMFLRGDAYWVYSDGAYEWIIP